MLAWLQGPAAARARPQEGLPDPAEAAGSGRRPLRCRGSPRAHGRARPRESPLALLAKRRLPAGPRGPLPRPVVPSAAGHGQWSPSSVKGLARHAGSRKERRQQAGSAQPHGDAGGRRGLAPLSSRADNRRVDLAFVLFSVSAVGAACVLPGLASLTAVLRSRFTGLFEDRASDVTSECGDVAVFRCQMNSHRNHSPRVCLQPGTCRGGAPRARPSWLAATVQRPGALLVRALIPTAAPPERCERPAAGFVVASVLSEFKTRYFSRWVDGWTDGQMDEQMYSDT